MNINGAHAPQPPPSSSKAEGFFCFLGCFSFFISKYAESEWISYFFSSLIFPPPSSPSPADVKACVSHQTSPDFFLSSGELSPVLASDAFIHFLYWIESVGVSLYIRFFERVFEVEGEVGEFKTWGQLAPLLLD